MSLEAIDRELAWIKERAATPRVMKLGCSTIAHKRLEFCASCVPALRDGGPNGDRLELIGWQLLALREEEAEHG